MSCKGDNSHFLRYVLISPDFRGLLFGKPFLKVTYMLTFFFSGLLPYLVGIKRRTSRCVRCKRDNSHFLRYFLSSPEAEILFRP